MAGQVGATSPPSPGFRRRSELWRDKSARQVRLRLASAVARSYGGTSRRDKSAFAWLPPSLGAMAGQVGATSPPSPGFRRRSELWRDKSARQVRLRLASAVARSYGGTSRRDGCVRRDPPSSDSGATSA